MNKGFVISQSCDCMSSGILLLREQEYPLKCDKVKYVEVHSAKGGVNLFMTKYL